ncbi:hypothetical protein N7456_012960 [Penicillium angulare]|uniref:Short-chain dehydrogenase/reductase SDR n=1 Tax=Penicillium angulare TaxID=116970 RepID=A0A9W9JVX4_9EURO|nr:hypothetical protein N7456_012960 [Penicillium angulare]
MKMSRNRLQYKVCIITGASSGIGRSIALAFAREGAALVVCGDIRRTPAGAPERDHDAEIYRNDSDQFMPTDELICRDYGLGKAIFISTNTTIAEQVQKLVDTAVEVGGRLDVMVNNAGIFGSLANVHEGSDEDFDRVMAVNIKGVYLGMKHAIRAFLKQEPDQQGQKGRIINLASTVALREARAGAAYNASKAAVVSLTKTTAASYGEDKIRCNAICPGFINTNMIKHMFDMSIAADYMAQTTVLGIATDGAGEIGKAAVFLASDESAWVTGATLAVDGGFAVHL